MHQDLRVLPVREKPSRRARPRPIARSRGRRPLLPSALLNLGCCRRGQGAWPARGARASPCRATGHRRAQPWPSAASAWGLRVRRFAQVRVLQNRTRGYAAEIRGAAAGEYEGLGRRPADDRDARLLFSSISGFGPFFPVLGLKSVLLHRILGEIRDLGCPTAPSGCSAKLRLKIKSYRRRDSQQCSIKAQTRRRRIRRGEHSAEWFPLDAFAGSPRTHGRAAVPPLRL